MESIEQPQRNLEREKTDFESAVFDFDVEELPTEFDSVAVADLQEKISSGHVFTLGEIHGIKENPEIAFTLIKKFGFQQIGLEWSKRLEKSIQKFLQDEEIDYKAIWNSSDGRITAGHFSLLKKLKDEGVGYFLFDPLDWSRRDESMADEIVARTTSGIPTIVMAGDAHTNMRDIRERDGETHVSMVRSLENKGKKFSIGQIEYLSGAYFNNRVRNFGSPDEHQDANCRFYKNEEDVYVYELPVATVADVPNPQAIYIE